MGIKRSPNGTEGGKEPRSIKEEYPNTCDVSYKVGRRGGVKNQSTNLETNEISTKHAI